MPSYNEATYGVDPWGGLFELGAARLLYMTRMGPRWRALADIIDARWSRILGVMSQMMLAFDLDSADGDQLDIIGRWLGREREGMSDDRYRRALRVQRLLLSSSSGSGPLMLRVFAAWTGATATEYANVPPAHVTIGGAVAVEDENALRQFILASAPAGVTLSVSGFAGDAALICDSISVPVDDPGVLDCIADPVTGAAPLAYEVL